VGRIDAEHFDLSPVARAEPLEDLDRRRLPRPVRPEEGEDLAVADLARSTLATASTSPKERRNPLTRIAVSMAGKLRRAAAPRIGSGAQIGAPPVGGGAAAALNPGAHDKPAPGS
jgi:hypothetical protein